MKNLLFILAFVLISSTGFSQTFTLSSSTPGTTQQWYTISTPQGNGYGYSYNISSIKSGVWIIAPPIGTLAVIDNHTSALEQSSGSGQVINLYGTSTMQILLIIGNDPYYGGYGYAQIYVYPY